MMTEETVITTDAKAETVVGHDAHRCVFMAENGQCEKLNNTKCGPGGCSFMILPGEEEQKRIHWVKRLSALDEAKQTEIAKKYSGGSRPWCAAE